MGEADEQRVTPLELFFDLVFVFAITQVTAFAYEATRYREARARVRSSMHA